MLLRTGATPLGARPHVLNGYDCLNTSGPYNPQQPALAFNSGDRLGPYEIVSALGAGGMGEVYRARDTKLDRDVAIKILPEGVRR